MKDKIKEWINNWNNDIKQLREETKQQNLVDSHSVVLHKDYPNISKEIFGCIQVGNDYIVFDNKKLYYDNVLSIDIKKLYQYKLKIAAPRIIFMGPLSLAFPKNKSRYEKMLVIEYIEDKHKYYMVFGGKYIRDDYYLIYQRYKKKKRTSS